MPRVLIACEFSGIVREEFRKAGCDAWSCDLLPTEIEGQHIQDDVLKHLNDGWDLMIAHPDCKYLCSSGMHWTVRGLRDPQLTEDAIEFVRQLLSAPISCIAIENPVGCISTRIRKPECIIHPWQFGHPESKTTCLWLKNLPPLRPTDILPKPENGRWQNQTPSGQNKLGPKDGRWKDRARTYLGIAKAMAEQWSGCVSNSQTNASHAPTVVSHSAPIATSITPTANVSVQAMPRMTDGHSLKKKESCTQLVNVEPDPYQLILLLSRTR